MSEHWRPGDKVVRGRFGGRGGGGSAWLSPEVYRAPSPGEKRVLHFERSKQRHERRFGPARARYRKGHFARQRLVWLAVAFGLTVAFTAYDRGGKRVAPAGAEIEWDAVAAVPQGEESAADRAWARRAAGPGIASDSDAIHGDGLPRLRRSQ